MSQRRGLVPEAPWGIMFAADLVEQVPDLMTALKARAASSPRVGSVRWYGDDANVAVDTICRAVPRDGLVLAVIDPTGLHFHFDSLAKLTKHPRV